MTEHDRLMTLAQRDPVRAAHEMTLGLMRGDAEKGQLGYTARAAALTAAEAIGLTLSEVTQTFIPARDSDDFVAFLHFLVDEGGADAPDIIYAVEKPHRFWAEYADYLISEEPGTMQARTTVGSNASY